MGLGTGDADGDAGAHTRRVLVVDDEPMVATAVAEYLDAVGDALDVVHTTAPTAALERLDGSFDWVVTDYEMPRLDGLALIERAETDAEFVVFSGVDDDAVVRQARERGATFVSKGVGTGPYDELATLVAGQER
ncbi:response regulator [Halomicroarcula sp. GCM10025709]|uniref:response regulator n=1 Tax=Haloarcula TaxID=2237 RepID=UPI0024C41676|nr:response regulator [Halomicroarcula sp. YJ-61-S]